MSGHPVPNRQRKRLLSLALTATEVKVHSATESLVIDDANDYNARNGCGTHAIGTDARRPPWYFAPPECSGRALAALLNGRASYEQCFASLASHLLHGRGSSAFGRRPSAV